MDWMKLVHGTTQPKPPAAFDTGDEVRVWYRILEQGKERFGQFEGIVIRVRGAGPSKTFTVRRVTYGEGVERVFPMDAKVISKIEVLRRGQVKRSRLYYLRTAVGKTRIASAETPGTSGISAQTTVPVVDATAQPQTTSSHVSVSAAAAQAPDSAKAPS